MTLTILSRRSYAGRMTKKRKSKRGGARAGAGRPVTTGSKATKPISFRVSFAQRAHVEATAADQGVTVGELAKSALLKSLKF